MPYGIFMMKTLNDVCPAVMQAGGIFAALELEKPPWQGSAGATFLDYQYHENRSGCKFISPMASKFVNDQGLLDLSKIASVLHALYFENWNRLWSTYYFDKYKPDSNVEIEQTETRDLAGTENISDADSKNRELTRNAESKLVSKGTTKDTDSTTDTVNETVNSLRYEHGFNSTGYTPLTPKSEVEQTTERTDRTESTGTSSVDSTDTTTDTDKTAIVDSETYTRDRDTTDTGTVKKATSGLDGRFTKQEILSADRELWLWKYFDQVMEDIDKVLCLPVYDTCRVTVD